MRYISIWIHFTIKKQKKKRRDIVIYLWKEEWKKFNMYYRRHFFMIASFFFLSVVGSYLTLEYMIKAGGYEEALLFIQSIFNGGGIDSTQTGMQFMFQLLLNNLLVCGLGILLGFIPIIILPYLLTIYNGLIVGFAIKTVETKGYFVSDIVFTGLLPHGLTELLGMFLAMGMGSFVSVKIAKYVLKKGSDEKARVRELVKMVGISYSTIIFPLLLISSAIEAYLTPLLFLSK